MGDGMRNAGMLASAAVGQPHGKTYAVAVTLTPQRAPAGARAAHRANIASRGDNAVSDSQAAPAAGSGRYDCFRYLVTVVWFDAGGITYNTRNISSPL